MAPVNGAPGIAAKPAARRAAFKPVVPVMPLRPIANKQVPSPLASSHSAQNQDNQMAVQEGARDGKVSNHNVPAVAQKRNGSSTTEKPDRVTPAAGPAPSVATGPSEVGVTPRAHPNGKINPTSKS